MEHSDWDNEQQRLDRVIQEMHRRWPELEQKVQGFKSEVVAIRKHFWDDVTVNMNTFDDALETVVSMRQQAEVLSERERGHRHNTQMLLQLEKLLRSPYFARMDF